MLLFFSASISESPQHSSGIKANKTGASTSTTNKNRSDQLEKQAAMKRRKITGVKLNSRSCYRTAAAGIISAFSATHSGGSSSIYISARCV